MSQNTSKVKFANLVWLTKEAKTMFQHCPQGIFLTRAQHCMGVGVGKAKEILKFTKSGTGIKTFVALCSQEEKCIKRELEGRFSKRTFRHSWNRRSWSTSPDQRKCFNNGIETLLRRNTTQSKQTIALLDLPTKFSFWIQISFDKNYFSCIVMSCAKMPLY